MLRVGIGEKLKMRVIFANIPLFSKIQTSSHKFVVRQTSHDHHCDQHAPKPIHKDFQVIGAVLPSQKQLVNFCPQ